MKFIAQKMIILSLSLSAMFAGAGCQYRSNSYLQMSDPFVSQKTPPSPDYAQETAWAALPNRKDEADHTPRGMKDRQADALADVFFVHPTTYTQAPSSSSIWNGSISDGRLQSGVDQEILRYQASALNGAGRIYAPRYRQAHISAYYVADKTLADQAFDVAYQDVAAAFQYYLDHYNQGRPIILASHSQGTTHLRRLMQSFFDGKPLHKQLVAAYLIGMPVLVSDFKAIPPCQSAEDLGCFISWRTYATGYYPPNYTPPNPVPVCTNPLSWRTDEVRVMRDGHSGGLLRNPRRLYKKLNDAQCEQGALRIERPHAPLAYLVRFTNYHVLDYNLFYRPISENAQQRVAAFVRQKSALTTF